MSFLQTTLDKVSDNLKEKIYFDNIYQEISRKGSRYEILQNLKYNLTSEVASKGSALQIQAENLVLSDSGQTKTKPEFLQIHFYQNHQE